ncbi:MAG: tetratricopeptide repeat protein, partial [Planctomycetota bacterium]
RGLAEGFRLLAELFFERADAALDRMEKEDLLAEALRRAEQAVKVNPQEAENWNQLSRARAGHAEESAGETDLEALEQALADARKAVELEPEESRFHETCAMRHLDLFTARYDAGQRDATLDDYHEAFEEVLRLRPDHPFAHSARAATYLMLAEELSGPATVSEEYFEKSLADLGRYAEQFPGSGTPFSYRGSVRRRRGDAQKAAGVDPVESYRKAVEDYTRAVELDRMLETAWRNRGLVRAELAKLVPDEAVDLLDDAELDFRAAFDIDPTNAESINRAGLARYDQALRLPDDAPAQAKEWMTRAADAFSKAIEVEPKWANLWRNRSVAGTWIATFMQRLGEDPAEVLEKSREDITRGILENTTSSLFWTTRAVVLTRLAAGEKKRGGDPVPLYHAAVRDYTCALRLEKEEGTGLEERAKVYMELARLGDPRRWVERAVKDYRKLALLRPYDFAPYSRQVSSWEELGKLSPEDAAYACDRSEETCSTAIGRGVGGAVAYEVRSNVLWTRAIREREQGRDPREFYRRAWLALGDLIRQVPTSEKYGDRAFLLLDRAEWETEHGLDAEETLRLALKDADAAVVADPDRAMGYFMRGRALRDLGLLPGAEKKQLFLRAAVRDLGRGLERDPGYVVGYADRALIRIHLGPQEDDPGSFYRMAVEDYTRAIGLEPENAGLHRNRSRTWLWVSNAAGDREAALAAAREAVADALRAVELEPTAESYDYLGMAYHILGDKGGTSAYRKALEAYREALRREPGNGAYEEKIRSLEGKVEGE